LWPRAAATGLVRGAPPFETYQTSTHVPRFLVPAGTPCAVRSVFTNEWPPFTTRDNAFEQFKRYVKDEGGPYDGFRSDGGGWILLVAARHVLRRPRWPPTSQERSEAGAV